MPDQPLYFLIAGEASGDLLGSHLMRALAEKSGGAARFMGVGGSRMRALGLQSLFPQEELAHMGVFELLRHIPRILHRVRETADAARQNKPAALITIDAPDFSFRVAKRLVGAGIPLIHYVAPTVWAWRPKRAKKVAKFLDHLLVLLPFEPPYFLREGLDCTFVGHPIVESNVGRGDAVRFRTKFALHDDALLMTLLPGSRAGELTRLMPMFAETVRRLVVTHPTLHIVLPTVPHLVERLRGETKDWPVPVTIVDNDKDKYDAFAASRAALACSGTVALELALARLPAVIAYKANPLTFAIVRRVIKVRFASLVNIMHNAMIVPEYLQEHCTPDKLTAVMDLLLTDEAARQRQIKGLGDVAGWLGLGEFIPSQRAAETVLRVVRDYNKAPQA